MANEFQSLNIVISGLEDTGQQIKVKDHNNRTYSFFKTKKDGGETVAYQDFKNFKVGDTAEITFKEVPYKEGTIRNIMTVRSATGQPHAEAVLNKGKIRTKPGREYWEQREAKRQNSIVLQVAFKAAVELQAAHVRSGGEIDKDRLYQDASDFYDWIINQVGDGVGASKPSKGIEDLEDAEKAF